MAAVNLEQDMLPWHVLKVEKEGNNAIFNIALKLLVVHAPFPIHPNGAQPFPLLLISKPARCVEHVVQELETKPLPFFSAVMLNGSCQCTGTHCPVVLLPKMPMSYAMTLQKSKLALVGEGHGMRLLAYHPLLSYSCQQRYPSRQGLVSDALSSHQKLAPHYIQQWQIQIQSKRP
jgi:hypothetical protein